MAKDPAFLFYPGDWQGGTMYLTHEQKGCYMDLLILQFNVGKFTEAQAKQVLSICFPVAWPMLIQKFKTDGVFFWNKRLQEEIEKRQNFSKSRRENALHPKKPKKKAEAYAKHMENENINENKDDNVIKIENFLCVEMQKVFLKHNPKYKKHSQRDFPALLSIAKFLAEHGQLTGSVTENQKKILEAWEPLCVVVSKDKFYSTKPLSTISNQIQELLNFALNGKPDGKIKYGSAERAQGLDRMFDERYKNG